MPRCNSCSDNPIMYRDRSEKIYLGNTGYVSQSLRGSGHPLMALATTVMGIGVTVANLFYTKVVYKCANCGREETSTEQK